MKRMLCALVLLSSCAAPSYVSLDQVQNACVNGASHAELTVNGSVARVLGSRAGRSGEHEGFMLTTPGCSPQRRPCPAAHLLVEVNTTITGSIPVRSGDAVTVRGQYECNDSVLHWTHHDPSGRHIGGFIDVNGIRYQ